MTKESNINIDTVISKDLDVLDIISSGPCFYIENGSQSYQVLSLKNSPPESVAAGYSCITIDGMDFFMNGYLIRRVEKIVTDGNPVFVDDLIFLFTKTNLNKMHETPRKFSNNSFVQNSMIQASPMAEKEFIKAMETQAAELAVFNKPSAFKDIGKF